MVATVFPWVVRLVVCVTLLLLLCMVMIKVMGLKYLVRVVGLLVAMVMTRGEVACFLFIGFDRWTICFMLCVVLTCRIAVGPVTVL